MSQPQPTKDGQKPTDKTHGGHCFDGPTGSALQPAQPPSGTESGLKRPTRSSTATVTTTPPAASSSPGEYKR